MDAEIDQIWKREQLLRTALKRLISASIFTDCEDVLDDMWARKKFSAQYQAIERLVKQRESMESNRF